MTPVPKLEVALQHLECALRLYYEEQHYSALHLAGAAEEILGRHVEQNGGQPAYKSIHAGALRLGQRLSSPSTPSRIHGVMNRAKNSAKHMAASDDDHVYFDPKEEAADVLDRAIADFYYLLSRLPLQETAQIRRFSQERASA